jgi:hypothetical protein
LPVAAIVGLRRWVPRLKALATHRQCLCHTKLPNE